MTPTSIVAYLALFTVGGFVFLFANLLVGRFLRPNSPNKEKLEIYECGEPTIGSSFVQFDLRFYVVALLFLIFDVEVALFFPWATVFGKANQLNDSALQSGGLSDSERAVAIEGVYRELGLPAGASRNAPVEQVISSAADLAWFSAIDIAVFFAVLMVGFFYVWKRGDLDWVRAMGRGRTASARGPAAAAEREPALVA